MRHFTIAGTGHRPDKLGGYYDDVLFRLTLMLCDYLEEVEATHIITGMALGFDTALCMAGLELGLHVTAAIPFKGQESGWKQKDRYRYHCLLSQCDVSQIVSSGEYQAYKMQLRNQWMIDRCDRLVALWSGDLGGTANSIHYATDKGIEYDNLWLRWKHQY